MSVTETKKSDQKIFEQLKLHFTQCCDATSEVRTAALDDIRFANGDQWSADLIKERKGRPCLTINKVDQSIKHICNEHRQNRASIRYRPFDSGADVNKSEIVNGLVRHITSNSNTTYAIDMAFDYMVSGGFGFFRVITDYIDPESFDQEILIKPVKNPLSVYFPLHLINEPDYSDAPYAFIRGKISKKEFEQTYPKIAIDSFSTSGEGDREAWVTEDSVYVVEYFVKEEKTKTIYLVTDGINKQTVDAAPGVDSGWTVLNQREAITTKIMWYKACGGGLLDSREWPGKYIPIIPMVGKEINIDGKIYVLSLTRNAKDAQRMSNYWKSLETEMIALQPKVPYIGAKGQFEGNENWKTANQKNYPYLEYEPISHGGQLCPPPQRTGNIGMDMGIVNAIREATDDIKATTGIFDASLGAKGNETSGVAINSRKRQGQTANYHFIDSAALATTYLGKILLDLIPKIFDTARIVRILGDDMQEKIAEITDGYFDDIGRYDVIVDIGPDYATKRTEIVESLSMLNQSNPMFAEMTGDYIANNLDIDGAKALGDRLKKFINIKYPGVIDTGENGISEAEVKEIIADLQKLQQTLQMKEMEAQQMQQIITQLQKQVEDKDGDRQVKMETAQIKAAADIDKAKIMAEPMAVANTLSVVEHIRDHDLQNRKLDIEEKKASAPARPAEKNK